eukprot:scaffold977_cov253-Pinguiococcus_pyrenoidosus.AAC.25
MSRLSGEMVGTHAAKQWCPAGDLYARRTRWSECARVASTTACVSWRNRDKKKGGGRDQLGSGSVQFGSLRSVGQPNSRGFQ